MNRKKNSQVFYFCDYKSCDAIVKRQSFYESGWTYVKEVRQHYCFDHLEYSKHLGETL